MVFKKKYYNEREAAEFLVRTIATLRNWRYLGKGPRYLTDAHGGIRYDINDLEAWVHGEDNERAAC